MEAMLSPHAERYAAVVFDPADIIELRALRGKEVAREYCLAKDITTPGVAGWITRHIAEQWNIYVGANPRKRHSGKAEDVAIARCLFVDFDGVTVEQAEAAISEAKLPVPSLLVFSGGGAHAYWRLTEPVTNWKLWTGLQKRLIATLGSDAVIHDPPRIMRLPGTVNFKRDPVRECVIVGPSGARHDLSGMGLAPVEDGKAYLPLPPVREANWKRALSRATLDFLVNGAVQGERQTRAFKAACDAAGCGASFDDAVAEILPAGRRCGLEDWEIEGAVRSAFSRPRGPSKPEPSPAMPNSAVTAWDVKGGNSGGGTVVDPPPASGTLNGRVAQTTRHVISNVISRTVESEDGKRSVELIYKPIEQLAVEIREACGDWPRRVNGIVFAYRHDDRHPIPTGDAIWIIDGPDNMGAWLHTQADVLWATSRKPVKNLSGQALSPATKGEVYELFSNTAEPNYRGVATLPHHPAMRGVYYAPCDLPPATGEALDELVASFNPESEHDRQLLLAATLTPGWGGEPGRRPPFVLTSEHGRGVGKTATVSAIADCLWGGVMTIKPDESFEKIIGRLLGNEGLATRCVLIDNVKGRLEGQAFEALVTSRTIDGWRPHHGQYSRPNDLTYFLTANTARLSKDLADRSVVIRLAGRRHEKSFVEWASTFIQENRPALIADIIDRLKSPPRGEIRKQNRDRWQDWQDSVLCRCDDPDGLAALIISRRQGVDDDSEDGARVADAVRRWLRAKNLTEDKPQITREEMRDLLVEAKVSEERYGVKATTRWIDQLLGDGGPLAALRDNPRHGGLRTWVWDWARDPNKDDDTPPLDIPV